MPFGIQRIARGLNEFLSIFGGNTPRELEDRVRPTLELVQFYGIQQLQAAQQTGGAVVEGGNVDVTMSVDKWTILFAAGATYTQTATLTALSASVQLIRLANVAGTGLPTLLAAKDLSVFGATATGLVQIPFWAPYPILCPPATVVRTTPGIIGTDANIACTVRCEFGVLG